MTYNLAALFERVVQHDPGREALVTSSGRLTYGQLDERAARLGAAMAALGVGVGDRVGLQLLNGSEYLEGMLAAFKLRAVPININYRYVERELVYLFDNADLRLLIVHDQFGPMALDAATQVDGLEHVVLVDDGSNTPRADGAVDYEEFLAGAAPTGPAPGRSGDDVYCAYTGGTTGMPKGVLWRHEDIFFAAMGGGDPTTLEGPISNPEQLLDRIPEVGGVTLLTPPLMHVSAHWGAFQTLFGGGKIILPPPGSLDPATVWELVAAEGVNVMVIVGDAMARPLADHLVRHPRDDIGLLLAIGSGGAILSAATRAQLNELLPNVIIVDGYGSSETGVAGSGTGDSSQGGPAFVMRDDTSVLDDDLKPVEPGSGTIGRVARRGHVPLGYHKDESKTAATFVEVDGQRWVLPGDMAMVTEAGEIVLLGRGSGSINTGGEKVFPEEVEAALKSNPAIFDALVVGVSDERWGQRVVALVEARPGVQLSVDEVRAHSRTELAGYKVPRDVILVDHVARGPNGKPDYGWAKRHAERTLAPTEGAEP